MNKTTEKFVLRIMNGQPDLTLATLREDGWPQANTVSYAHDGLTIIFGTDANSQKVKNIHHCNKVSLTINSEYEDWEHIKGVSMAATAQILTRPAEVKRAAACLMKRFPEAADWADSDLAESMVLVKLTPKIVSVLDYTKGFGYTNLVTV
jgi:hypothetical protein